MQLYVGIDLHSNNSYITMINEDDRIIYEKRLSNEIDLILQELSPYTGQIEGIVLESTYNWYWLADGLIDNGYKVHLANTMAIQQYSGLKQTNDKTDARWLAQQLKLGVLPEGYIYPKEQRGLRELLRKRMRFVQQRTMILLATQSMISRYIGLRLSAEAVKKLTSDRLNELTKDKDINLLLSQHLAMLNEYLGHITIIEQAAFKQIRPNKAFKNLTTIPGVGKILAALIVTETGDINRFHSAGDYCSYCRCVKSIKISNGKKKGANNRKNGNVYLSWVFIEAANYAIRCSKPITKYYQRKTVRSHRVIAIKSVAAKLSKAAYFIMKEGKQFEIEKTFN